jgi:uncharacterized protein YidB (DUF937 family)
MFDELIREVASRYGLGADQAASILRSLLNYIFKEHPGALTGLVDQFKKAGLGDVAASWVGGAAPREIAPERLETVVGADVASRLASSVNLGKSVLLPVLSFLLPKVIGLLTRDGIPAGIPAGVANYLAAPAHHRAEPEPNPLRWLWWLLIPILALLFWRWCAAQPAPVPEPTPLPVAPIATPAPTPVPTPTPVVEALPATVFFALAEKTLDAEDDATIAAVVEWLKANPAAKVDVTGYADKTGAKETNVEIAKERAKSVRAALEAAGVGKDRINMKPPAFITGSVNDAEARRVEIHKAS